jgi:hypothetical protein
VVQEFNNLGTRQLVEPEPDEFVLKPLVDLADVIAYQTKANAARIILQEIAEGLLCVLRHVVDFIQNNELHAIVEEGLRVHEETDLIADDVDASLVGCIQMDNQVLVLVLQLGLV